MNRLGNRLLAVLLSALLLLGAMPVGLAEEVKADAPIDSLRFQEDAFKKQVSVTSSAGTYLYLGSGSSYTVKASDLIVKNTQGKTLSANEYTLAVTTSSKKFVTVAKDHVTIKAKKKNESGTQLTITATAGGASKSLSLIVGCPGKPTVAFKTKAIETASTAAIDLNKYLTVGPTFTAADGKTYNLMGVASFTAKKNGSGTVTEDGVYTPGAAGSSTTVTAKAGGKKSSVTIYNGQETASIAIKDAAGKLVPLYDEKKTTQTEYGVNKTKKAQKVSFTAQALAADGKTAAACQSFTWTTSDKKIGTVKVAKKTGVATVTLKKTKAALSAPQTLLVTAVSAAGKSASFVMQLFPQGGTAPGYKLDVTPVVDQNAYGKKVQYNAAAKKLWIDKSVLSAERSFELGASMKAPGVEYKWTTANPGMEVKDGKLIVKKDAAAGKGVLSISATDATAASTTLTVEIYAPVTGISLDKTALKLAEGGAESVTATVNPGSTYTAKDLIWTVYPDAPYVEVSAPDAAGKVTITAKKGLPFGAQDKELKTQLSIDSPDPMDATANLPITIQAGIGGLKITLAEAGAKPGKTKDGGVNAVKEGEWLVATATNPGTPDDPSLVEWSFAAAGKDFTNANTGYTHKIAAADFGSKYGKFSVSAAVKGATPAVKDSVTVFYYGAKPVTGVKMDGLKPYYTKANAPTQLSAKGYNGSELADNADYISYKNNNAATAAIDETGKVSFVAYGKVSATAIAQEISDDHGAYSAKIEYTVVEHAAASIVAGEGNATSVVKGKTAQMKALVKSADKAGSGSELINADVQDIVWTLKGSPVGASIDEKTGLLSAKSDSTETKLTVVATAKDDSVNANVKAEFEVLVIAEMPAAIKVTVGTGANEKEFSEGNAYVGKDFSLNVTLYSDAAGKTKAANQEIIWTSSDKDIAPAPAEKASPYSFKPLKATSAKRLELVATSRANPALQAKLHFDVLVGANTVELKLLVPETKTFKVGAPISLTAKALDGSSQPVKEEIVFKMGATEAAATEVKAEFIKDYEYKLIAPAAGAFNIYAYAKNDTGKKAEIKDLVSVAYLAEKIAVTLSDNTAVPTVVYSGQSLKLLASVKDQAGNVSSNQKVKWEVSPLTAVEGGKNPDEGATATIKIVATAATKITVKATSVEAVKTPATLTLPEIAAYAAAGDIKLKTSGDIEFSGAAPWTIYDATVTAQPKVAAAAGSCPDYKWSVTGSAGVTINEKTGLVTFPSATASATATVTATVLDGSNKSVTGTINHKLSLTSLTLSAMKPYVGEQISSTLLPATAAASYAWYKADSRTASDWGTAIATTSAYAPRAEDKGFYLKLVATGSGDYAGTKEVVTDTAVLEKWTLLPSIATAPDDSNKADATVNQSKASVKIDGTVITVTADLANMKEYTSKDSQQTGASKWLAVAIGTGKTLTNVTVDSHLFTDADIADAASCGVKDGKSFIFWIRAENAQYSGNGRTFILKDDTDKMLETSFTLKVVQR